VLLRAAINGSEWKYHRIPSRRVGKAPHTWYLPAPGVLAKSLGGPPYRDPAGTHEALDGYVNLAATHRYCPSAAARQIRIQVQPLVLRLVRDGTRDTPIERCLRTATERGIQRW
jgi:hypothetical protein